MAIRTATVRGIQKGILKEGRRKGFSSTLKRDIQMARFGILNWLLSVALVVAVILGIWCSFQIALVGKELNSLRARQYMLKKQNLILSSKLSNLTSQKRLEKLGKSLGLRPPATDQKIRLNE